jgi:Ca2+-binding EF-hand superfamily protein
VAQSGTLQDQNISVVFDSLDSDRSGTIGLDDLDGLARGICARIGVPAGSDPERRLIDAYHAWWDGLQSDLDTDNNQIVTREEFAEGFRRPGVQEKSGEHSRKVARVIAELLDTDGDGQISQDEYVRLVTQFDGLDDNTAVRGFQQLDKDGDGAVSVAELEAGWHQMLNSADASAPGAALLGKN